MVIVKLFLRGNKNVNKKEYYFVRHSESYGKMTSCTYNKKIYFLNFLLLIKKIAFQVLLQTLPKYQQFLEYL